MKYDFILFKTILLTIFLSQNVLANDDSDNCLKVSGIIQSSGGFVEGVEMTGLPWVIWSDESGRYSVCVDEEWSGTVRPRKAGYDFDPVERIYGSVTGSHVEENYLATEKIDLIAGRVVFNGNGLSGAIMAGLPGNPMTNSNGEYSIEVPFHWSGTVMPQKSSFSFSPASRRYIENAMTQLGEDYTAIQAGFEISGRVTLNGNGLENVLVAGVPGSILTNADGYYVGTLPYGWSGTVTPLKAGYQFSPISYTSVTSSQLNQNHIAAELPSGTNRVHIVSSIDDLNYVSNVAQNGEIILVNPGIYDISGGLSFHGGVELRSIAGASQTVLKLSSDLRINAANIIIDGFTKYPC